MNRRLARIFLLLAVAHGPLSAQSSWHFPSAIAPRAHPFDVLHIALDLSFDTAAGRVDGNVVHTLRSLNDSLMAIDLDAAPTMIFSKVEVDGHSVRSQHEGEQLHIELPAHRAWGDTFAVSITWSVVPEKGLYFIRPDSIGPIKRWQIWTQGQDEDHHFWMPLYDSPNDLLTSEVRARVPASWNLLSNGRMVSRTPDSDSTVLWHWRQEQPHAAYLIVIAAGEFLVTHDSVDGLPLEYWTYPEYPERVQTTFARTPEIIRFLSDYIGVDFPWPAYRQAVLTNFTFGGMENTTATMLNDYILVDRRGLLDYDPDGIIAHEASHQWFGDLVTNRGWGDRWLHESFATYLADRFMESRYGSDRLAYAMQANGAAGLALDNGVGRDPLANGHGMSGNIYERGSRVLYMLNNVVGDRAFRRAIRHFLERNRHRLVQTSDLQTAFEDVTGEDLQWFFDQWIYGAGHPNLVIETEHDDNVFRIRVQQTQTLDSLTGLFRMRIPIEIYTDSAVIRQTITIDTLDATWSIPVSGTIRFVIFDAGDVHLKNVEFPRSHSALIAQLDAPRMIDRYLAVDELFGPDIDDYDNDERDERTRALVARYNLEPSSYVRSQIVERVPWFTPGNSTPLMRLALRDSSVWVRKQAVDVISVIEDNNERIALLRPMLADSSMNVAMGAFELLAALDTTGLELFARQTYGVRGRRDRLAMAWLAAVGNGGFRNFLDSLPYYTASTWRNDVRSLAYMTIARIDGYTERIGACLVRGMKDPSEEVQHAAADAIRSKMNPDLQTLLQLAGQTLP